MEYLLEFLTVALLHLLAVISPGPDFVIVTKNTLSYSRKIGIYSAVGVAFGIMVHVAYSLVGIGLIISQSILLFNVVKVLGAAYLIYIGYKAFTSKLKTLIKKLKVIRRIRNLEAVKIGFLTNVLNPKATLFFFSLFTQFISTKTSAIIKAAYGVEMTIATFLWFALVAVILSHKYIKGYFSRFQHYVERVMGAILIALGVKILSEK